MKYNIYIPFPLPPPPLLLTTITHLNQTPLKAYITTYVSFNTNHYNNPTSAPITPLPPKHPPLPHTRHARLAPRNHPRQLHALGLRSRGYLFHEILPLHLLLPRQNCSHGRCIEYILPTICLYYY